MRVESVCAHSVRIKTTEHVALQQRVGAQTIFCLERKLTECTFWRIVLFRLSQPKGGQQCSRSSKVQSSIKALARICSPQVLLAPWLSCSGNRGASYNKSRRFGVSVPPRHFPRTCSAILQLLWRQVSPMVSQRRGLLS